MLNNHTKQLHSKNSAQFYVVRPIHAAPAIPACHKRPFAYIWPTNGQTAENRAKPSPPQRPPLNLSPNTKFPWPNGFSRRTRLSHEVLPSPILPALPVRTSSATAHSSPYIRKHLLWGGLGSPTTGEAAQPTARLPKHCGPAPPKTRHHPHLLPILRLGMQAPSTLNHALPSGSQHLKSCTTFKLPAPEILHYLQARST